MPGLVLSTIATRPARIAARADAALRASRAVSNFADGRSRAGHIGGRRFLPPMRHLFTGALA